MHLKVKNIQYRKIILLAAIGGVGYVSYDILNSPYIPLVSLVIGYFFGDIWNEVMGEDDEIL